MDRRSFLAGGVALAAAGVPALATTAAHAAGTASTAGATAAAALPAATLPSREDMVAVLRRVADQWIGAHPNSGDNEWANATLMSGLMALYRLTSDPAYLNYVTGWAQSHSYGLNGGNTTRDADSQCAGQAYLDLYDTAPAANKIAAIEACLHNMTYVNQVSKDDDWWWVDALHMAMPQFARLGALRGDSGYFDKLHRLYTHTKSAEGGPGLYSPTTGLWYRDKNFLPGGIVSPSGKPVVWSRGNGWAAAAHTKVLKALPAGQANVAEYRSTLAKLVTAVAQVQRSDGFWNVNLADPNHFPGPETSGTVFFVYGTAYAIGAGLVDSATYLPVAARAWNGLVATAVHADGSLGYVQKVGDRPDSSQPVTSDSTADFGVGGFLLGGTELAALAAPAGGAGLPASGTYALRARINSRYVTAENAGASPLIARAATAQAWETFDLAVSSGGSVTLRAHADNLFVSAANAGASALIAKAATAQAWEAFTLVANPNGSVSLRAQINGKYVTAAAAGASPLIASAPTIGTWEQFDVVPQ
ncbi:glycoside hydrolase family 88 protein [Streptacidiphilus sp. N1-12]|uniref:Glycoside hydrolase family 88 protein n=2 Tax=Streptacidiphilus alkalitolerans TaxID=3342712 RepID=A0ABV6WIP9_9ACTN